MTDPLDSRDPDAAPDANGAQLLVALVACACVMMCAMAWRTSREAKEPPIVYPGETLPTPQAVASWRALPPEKQLTRIAVAAYPTMADVSCQTLEPSKMHIQYASAGGATLTTSFAAIRPVRLHVTTLENLKAGTDYNFKLTTVEADTGVPRVTRRGSFRTPRPEGPAPVVTTY